MYFLYCSRRNIWIEKSKGGCNIIVTTLIEKTMLVLYYKIFFNFMDILRVDAILRIKKAILSGLDCFSLHEKGVRFQLKMISS